jgi:hypothetical protein
MVEWFGDLSNFEKVYWVVTLASSVIFLILLMLTLTGGDVDDLGDVDAEIDGDSGIGFQFLTFKNLIGFLTIFGWSGISLIAYDFSKPAVVGISVFCGLLMMFAMAGLFYYLSNMDHSGNLVLKNAIGNTGEVYLNIGANRSKLGKIQINVQGSLRDLEALTDSDTELTQGDVVTVTEITKNGVLIVNKHIRTYDHHPISS